MPDVEEAYTSIGIVANSLFIVLNPGHGFRGEGDLFGEVDLRKAELGSQETDLLTGQKAGFV